MAGQQEQEKAAAQQQAKADEFYAMSVLAGLQSITDADLEVVLAAERLSRLLSKMEPVRQGQNQSRAACMAYLDRYFGDIMDRIQKVGLRLRYKP